MPFVFEVAFGYQGVRPDERRHTMRARDRSQQHGDFKGEGYIRNFL
ncbi:hypothetical protein Rin_00006200 [Candidatus Regiella insecticola 5.15]|uniref:Uncharacterized protein n=1 Tax=Candidatus Regiella insecticola 5.15 TaxID=1005043 RepID=G2GXX6_9ENTR|nr:hypothetical protein [Candidatus Regiella insecticola]EGY29402.1 hypothetical protein Rin_00006200 [Candidatus Regiella insecticola 5.15]